MKKIYLLCFYLLLGLHASAQFSRSIAEMKRDQATEKKLLQSQPLLIQLQREDPKELKRRASEPANLQAYKEHVAYVNELLRQVAGRLWTLSPNVEFKYEDEIEALVAANTGQLNVLTYGPLSLATSPPGMKHSWDPSGVSLPGGRTSLSGFELKIYVKKVVFSIHKEPVLSETLQVSDVVYCIRMLEQYARGNNMVLAKWEGKPRTLLLCQDYRAPNLTDEQIKQVYPYPYEFVSRAAYEKAVQEAAPEYAFVRFSWAGYGSKAPMAFTLPMLETVCGGDLQDFAKQPVITLKDFKSFKKTMASR